MFTYENSQHADEPQASAPTAQAEAPTTDDQGTFASDQGPLTYDKPEPVALPVPADIEALRKSDPDFALHANTYATDALRNAIENALAPDGEGEAVTPEQRTALVQEFGRIRADLGLSDQVTDDFVSVSEHLMRSPPSDEQQVTWQDEARDQIKRQYGADADQALRDAQLLARRDPRVAAWLDHTRAGNHPRVIAALCEAARRERGKGRLK